MVVPRAASQLRTVRLLHSRGRPTVRLLPGRGKPTGRPLLVNVRPARVGPPGEASGLTPHGTPRPTGVPALVEVLQRANGPQRRVSLRPTGVLALVEVLQRVNEPRRRVSPQLAGLPAAEARVPSEGAPGDITDPALAPQAPAVPPVWDHAVGEAPAPEAVVGADETCTVSASTAGLPARLEGRS